MAKKRGNTSLYIMLVVIAILGALILLLPSCICGGEGSEDDSIIVNVGDKAPDFTVEMFDTPSITLSDLKGKVVLINFWASWCPHCVESMKIVEADIIDRFEGRNFLFLPISRGETKGEVAAFREANGYTFPMGLDPNRLIYDKYALESIPRSFLIDENGVVIMTTLGNDEHDKLIEKIESITQ